MMTKGAPSQRASSTKIRRQVFDANKWIDSLTGRTMLTCHLCNGPIDPVREKWEAEHVIRRALTESDDPSGILPAHAVLCHPAKSRRDNDETAKGKRVREKFFNIRKTANPMLGSRNHPSGLRKRMSGKIERWDDQDREPNHAAKRVGRVSGLRRGQIA